MEFKLYIHQVIAIAFVPPAFVRLAWSGLQENSPDFDNKESFVQYFESTWIDGNFPICSWNVYTQEGPCINNNAEGWHSKMKKLARKSHPNIYEAVTLFKSEQAATEVSLMQLAAGGLPRRRRKYRTTRTD
ncbi:uncharacterized protein LOC121391384 [Gigantopelta aegis]|uniref:uncharacterized protein LOC121391384 n=1 Tax=Gigantopelta aegis TaxID=1735272 RepID=UPI001B88D6F3|nr:uncharacterized protein LOC121391384 [Gigantopelta aegis]